MLSQDGGFDPSSSGGLGPSLSCSCLGVLLPFLLRVSDFFPGWMISKANSATTRARMIKMPWGLTCPEELYMKFRTAKIADPRYGIGMVY